jgi:hypothetical protein
MGISHREWMGILDELGFGLNTIALTKWGLSR